MNTYFCQFSFSVLLLIGFLCNGQTKTKLPKKHTVYQDLSNTHIPKRITRTIVQGKDGTILFATWDGVIKYDGTTFSNLTSTLTDSRFFSLLEDRNQNFWLGALGSGAYYHDGETFQNFTTAEGLVNNTVLTIYEDKQGTIWFGTAGGVSRYDGKSFQNFTIKDGLQNNEVNSILEDQTGKLWFGTRGNACFYDGVGFSDITTDEGTTFKNIRHIIETEDGCVWLGGNDGLWRYDGNTFTNVNEQFVGYMYEDRNRNLWTSSESETVYGWALSQYDAASLTKEKSTRKEIMVEDNMFFGILEDFEGHIWFGNLNGVYRYDGSNFIDFKDNVKKFLVLPEN